MYTAKEVCKELGIPYETLKFYSKEGLVPNVHRDKNNRRVFDDRNLGVLKSLLCLRKCGMSIKDMKIFVEYGLQGKSTIPERKAMLEATEQELLEKQKEIQESLDYIAYKHRYYDDVMAGKTKYHSNLIDGEE